MTDTMALCVYHETTEASQACRVCKQDVCSKCLEYGEDGMCGMCLEMANARKATAEAARQARTEAAMASGGGAAAAQPRPAGPRPPNGPGGPARPPAPKSPTGGKGPAPGNAPPRKTPTGAPANGRSATGAPAPSKPAAKPGMCATHPDQKAAAACTHCEKKVCPYCLDLYDLCVDCRNLPSCARHESMVAQAKCVSCKMDYCKVCLNGTDQCDRCRSIGAPKDPSMVKPPAPPPKPKAKGTTELKAPSGGLPGDKPAAPRQKVKPADHIYRPPTGKGGAVAKKNAKAAGPPIPVIAGAVVLVLAIGAFVLSGGGKPALSEEQAIEALQEEMAYVQQAAIAYESKNGRYPDSEEMILEGIKAKGVNVDKLKLPIKLAINSPAVDPYAISYRLVGDGFEVRGCDSEGRPLMVKGKDVVYTNQVNGTSEGSLPPPDPK